MEQWRTDIQDWTKINKDLINFYLNQAESELKMSLDLHDKITQRAFTILSILIPVITVCLGLLLRYLTDQNIDKFLLTVTLICLLATIFTLFILVKLIFPRFWMPLGRQPKDIFVSEMIDIDIDYTPEERYVGIVMREIENIQDKIDYNYTNNIKRLKLLKTVIIAITSILSIVIFLIIRQILFFIA